MGRSKRKPNPGQQKARPPVPQTMALEKANKGGGQDATQEKGMNANQKAGIAGVLDNFGVLAISSGVVITFGFGKESLPSWLLFVLLAFGAICFFGAYWLRK